MKQKFYNIAKKTGHIITNYITYRSDMGCQCYEISVDLNNCRYNKFYDGYFVEEELAKEKILRRFKSWLNDL